MKRRLPQRALPTYLDSKLSRRSSFKGNLEDLHILLMSLVGNTPFLYLKKVNGIFVLFVLLTTVACYRKENIKEIYPKMQV